MRNGNSFKNAFEWIYVRALSLVHVIQAFNKILSSLCIVLSVAEKRKWDNLIAEVQ